MLVELGEKIAAFSVETVVPVPDAAPEGPAAVRITVVVLGKLIEEPFLPAFDLLDFFLKLLHLLRGGLCGGSGLVRSELCLEEFFSPWSEHTSRWDHPDQPAHLTHRPMTERLRHPDYYENPRYDAHPAVCVTWWSAYAFAAFEGKRLPTALEWEAAARGTDGRLFPWGDTPETACVNCADSWVGRPVV